jgi:hypothetical protein
LRILDDDLDFEPDESLEFGGGNFIPRAMSGPGLLVAVATSSKSDLAETAPGWGQSRPPCPYHSHPAAPVLRDGDAWWISPSSRTPVYRIGQGEVPTRL